MLETIAAATAAYKNRFHQAPKVGAVAPGRIEVLGNHTDYNGGLVLAAAIDRVAVVVGESLDGGEIIIHAPDIDDEATCSAYELSPNRKHSWANYVIGVADELRRAHATVGGFQAVVHSEVPVGSGLSSSAALEVASALFLLQMYPTDLDPMELARLCQRAENNFVGVNSGLLDQFSSVFGAKGSFLFLDCYSLEHRTVPLADDRVVLIVCDSMDVHSLTSGHYNERRRECEAAAEHFGRKLLREVTDGEYEAGRMDLPENVRKRADHVMAENHRVTAGITCAERGDLAGLGRAMLESHRSSRDLFENSTPALDFLVETAAAIPGCYGARLTGGGWGGATVNLVDAAHSDAFRAELAAQFERKYSRVTQTFVCAIADGARMVTVGKG